jgi:hypothetical protein
MPRVRVEHILRDVARICPAHILVDILITIVINVAKRYPVPFLQMPETARGGHILEPSAAVVPKHAIGNERR